MTLGRPAAPAAAVSLISAVGSFRWLGRRAPSSGQPRQVAEREIAWKAITIVLVVYLAAFTVALALRGTIPTVDYIVPALFLLALVLRRGSVFLADWIPFVFILLGYEEARGLAYRFGGAAHVGDVAHFEGLLFGNPLPTVRLQRWASEIGVAGPANVIASAMYLLHFIVPVGLGFWVWLKSRRTYWRYILALLGVSYAGFITYALFPEAPPWMAADQGIIHGLSHIFPATLASYTFYSPFSSVYNHIDPNPVAAMPSLHVAYPTLVALTFIRVIRRKWSWLAMLYPLTMSLAVVYMGEHYVIDCFAGVAYGGAFFWLAFDSPALVRRLLTSRRPKRTRPLANGIPFGSAGRGGVPLVVTERVEDD